MATITKTYTEDTFVATSSTWTLTFTGVNVTASGTTFTMTSPTVTAKYVGSNKGRANVYAKLSINNGPTNVEYSFDKTMVSLISWASGESKTVTKIGTHTATHNTAWYFTSSNKTSRTVNVACTLEKTWGESDNAKNTNINEYYVDSPVSLGTIATITLNAPPTFTATATSSAPYYANVSTYRVNLASLSAKYGGTISSAVLTVGSQTASRTTNGELAIALNATGTFTPSVKVTDSRGQVTTVNLSQITVGAHTAPTVTAEATSTAPYYTRGTTYTALTSNPVTYDGVSVASVSLTIGSQTVTSATVGQLSITPNIAGTFTPTVTIVDSVGSSSSVQLPQITVLQYSSPTMNGSVIQRTESTGKPNEEDTSAVIGYQLTWVEDLGHIQRPKVYIGTSTTEATVTWYKTFDPTSTSQTYLSNPITDWDTIISGDIVYAFIANEFLIGDSYAINATASDDFTTSVVFSMTLAQAFFTIDFLAGGHGIAFGQLASDVGFWCNMEMYLRGHRVPIIYVSDSNPTTADGEDGDIWITY